MVVEADESDGSIVQYHPDIGLLLNIEKDHQEIDELVQIFSPFRDNTKDVFISNQSNKLASKISKNIADDFSVDENIQAGLVARNFSQKGFEISFSVNEISVRMNALERHNMENALAAMAVVSRVGVELQTASEAMAKYEGIYRRHQIIGEKHGVILSDDYAPKTKFG